MMHHRTLLPVASLFFATTLLAQDPWAKVSAMPTSCYGKEDEFGQTLRVAKTELETAAGTQSATNQALLKQMSANPTAMITALQKNPTRAAEIMNEMQKMGGPSSPAEVEAAGAKQKDFDQRATKLTTDYKADKAATLYPIHTRIRNHSHEAGGTAADKAIVKAGWIEFNQKYETVLCAKWLGREALALLAAYKEYLVGEHIPKGLEAEAKSKSIIELLGVPTGDFHPVTAHRAVVKYLELALQLFDVRQSAPNLPP